MKKYDPLRNLKPSPSAPPTRLAVVLKAGQGRAAIERNLDGSLTLTPTDEGAATAPIPPQVPPQVPPPPRTPLPLPARSYGRPYGRRAIVTRRRPFFLRPYPTATFLFVSGGGLALLILLLLLLPDTTDDAYGASYAASSDAASLASANYTLQNSHTNRNSIWKNHFCNTFTTNNDKNNHNDHGNDHNNNNGAQTHKAIESHTHVEVSHCGGGLHNSNSIWLYAMGGSELFVNVGATIAFGTHEEAAEFFLKRSCKNQHHVDLRHRPQCDEELAEIADEAEKSGYESIQFLQHCDAACENCDHEIVLIGHEGDSGCRETLHYFSAPGEACECAKVGGEGAASCVDCHATLG